MKTFLSKFRWAIVISVTTVVSAGPMRAQTPEAAQAVAVPSRITRAVDDSRRMTLRGNVHPLARAEFDRGPVPPGLAMNRMLLVLKRSEEQEKALQELLTEQMDKNSPKFHKWLAPEEFGRRFGPSDADVQTVVSWLRLRGFQVKGANHGRNVIEFSGTALQAEEAFTTKIHRYVVNGSERWANTTDPQIPEAISPVVGGIVSLHNFPPKSMMHNAGEFVKLPGEKIRPLLTATGTSGGTVYALGPADFAKIYNIDSTTMTGAGQTIAIVGVSDFDMNDVVSFRNFFSLPPANVNVIFDGPNPGFTVGKTETLLDIEWAGAVAPQAQINYVASDSVGLAMVAAVDNNLGNILSASFGDCEANLGGPGGSGNQFFNALWAQAAAEGITVLVSSGDGAADGCDDFRTATKATSGAGVSGLASTPFNIAVGGTDFDDVGTQSTFWDAANAPGTQLSAKGYIPETTWNDSCAQGTGGLTACNNATGSALNIVGGSGGRSTVYSKPAWQNGVTPTDSQRDLPDVSLFAAVGTSSRSFYVVCQADAVTNPATSCSSSGSFSFIGVGGTSASTPAMAGIIALIGQATGQRVGNANYLLYKIAAAEKANLAACDSSAVGGPAASCVFDDVTKGNNSVPCAGGSPNCSSSTSGTTGVLVDPLNTSVPAYVTSTGFDLATGVGSVNVKNLLAAWVAAESGLTATTTTTSGLTVNGIPQTTVSAVHGTSVSLVVAVTPNPGAGSPSESVSVVTDRNLNVNTFGASTAVAGAALDGTGSAAVTTQALPGGAYNIFAQYPGDAALKPSDSSASPIAVNITPEASQLQVGIVTFDVTTGAVLNTDAKTFSYGSPYIFRMRVLNSSGTACTPPGAGGSVTSGCPSGIVMLTDNGAPLDGGSFKLTSAGRVDDQLIQLLPGAHALVTSYGGDISFSAPSGAVTDNVTVTQASTTAALTASPTSILKGGSVTLTAVISTLSNGVAPTGTVKFLNGIAAIAGTVTLTPVNGGPNGPAKLTATLTTTLSALLPPAEPWRTPPPLTPYPWIMLAAALLAVGRILARRPKRRVFAYAGITIAALLAGIAAGCGGGGGGGSSARTLSVSASYSGDTNYTASSSTATVTVQ